MNSRRFADLRASQAADLDAGAILILPIGAVEQHGPHLPLSTDVVIAERAAEAVVARSGEALDLWLLPTLTVGLSAEHTGIPGTLTLTPSTLFAILDELGQSLAALPPKRLVIVNAHGGNTSLLGVACRQLRIRHDFLTFLMHPMLPTDHGGSAHGPDGEMGIHAGHEETSLMLHLAPELVDMSLAQADLPTWLEGHHHVGISGPVSFGWTTRDLSDSGVIGDPTAATAAEGAVLFGSIVDSMTEALAEVRRFSFAQGRAS